MKVDFTLWWNDLNTHQRSGIIAGGGLIIAIILLKSAEFLFPGADFSGIEYAVVAAIGTFIMHLITTEATTI